MPPRRRAKAVVSDSSDDDGPPEQAVDSDSEVENPRKATASSSKPKAKRRPSAPFVDASNNDFTVPLKDNSTPTRNSLRRRASGFIEVDDRAEKRKRRRSTRVSFAGGSGDVEDEEGNVPEGVEPRKSLNTSVGEKDRPNGPRPSMRTARLSTGNSLRINAVAPAPAPAISLDVMNTNFEEWMKMATDNKINAANSWNFALIDYFHDMSLLRNTDDNSINFQKASFTLDGCVKIWTSRVDSVGTETGKLLSNLAQDNGKGGDDDEEGEEGGEDADGEEGGKKKTKVHRTEATLVKSYQQLQLKKLDLDFAVDPLFRKTRAEFDEGGATGLLLNHLGVDAKMRVVFDSGDSKITDNDDEENDEAQQVVDLEAIRALLPPLDTLEERTIAQDLSEFRFSSDPTNLDFAFLSKNRDDDDDLDQSSHRIFVKGGAAEFGYGGGDDDSDHGGPTDFDMGGGDDMGAGGTEDFFTGENAAADVFGGDPAPYMPYDGDDEDGTQRQPGGPMGGMEPFDPRRAPNERNLVMALNMDEDQNEMLDYFDSKFMKNWAGPEHWKLRRAIKKPEAAADAPRTRKEKVAFTIDFLNPPEQTAKQLFAPASKSTMITLPAKSGAKAGAGKTSKTKKSAKRDDHLLPDDMHFTSQQLLRLFLKPKFTLKMRRYGVSSGRLNDLGDGEVDEHFWAEANNMGGNEMDQTTGGGPIPFNTQFFHDDFDDDDQMEMDEVEGALPMIPEDEGDLLAQTRGPLKRVRPEFVNYARKAKRVDVRKLKENIWKGLKIVTDSAPAEGEMDAAELDPPTEPPTDPSQPSTFNSVISGLRTKYSADKMEEISTSFCFICLLHLANERGLKLEVGESEHRIIPDDDDEGDDGEKDEEVRREERKVGDIWSLNVYRDPGAVSSA